MSTPISSLRKSKKTPMPGNGQRPLPFRPTQNITEDESRLLSDVSTQMASSRMAVGRQSVTGLTRMGGTTPHKGPSDNDLMSLMMAKLAALENKVLQQTKEIIEKDKKIQILEEKVHLLRKTRETEGPGRTQDLERKCLMLQQQVHEMEDFLADYGMVWKGESVNPDSAYYNDESVFGEDEEEEEMWRPESSLHNPEFHVDYDLILENIKDLNSLAGEGIATIQSTKDGARLKMPDPVPLTLYANGILLFSGPFRPFSEPTTQACVRDIMDGYFPSELQSKYPDGIPISVTDKRSVFFKPRRDLDAFKGVGQILGGDTKPSRLVPSNLDKKTQSEEQPTVNETTELPGQKMSVEQFLNKLPSNVIRDGKIIDIRGSLGNTLQGTSSPGGVVVVETSAVQEMKARLEKAESERPPSSRDITTLRIKSDIADQNFIVKMRFGETIGDLRAYLNKHRPRGAPAYDIVSAFPRRVYTDISASLQSCDLIPNAALHLQPAKR